MGKNLYPKPPDMRQPQTQSLTEGELYNIIRNGVRMSGMPAWGKPKDGDSDQETWMLVLFHPPFAPGVCRRREGHGEVQPEEFCGTGRRKEEKEFLNGKSREETTHEHYE
jgi:hypothetical protein